MYNINEMLESLSNLIIRINERFLILHLVEGFASDIFCSHLRDSKPNDKFRKSKLRT